MVDNLVEAGILFPETQESSAHGDELKSACERAHVAWQRGEMVDWPDIEIPARPLSVSELFGLADGISFTLRRSSDGYRGSRPAALAAIALAERLRRARSAALEQVRVSAGDVRMKKVALDMSYLLVGIVPGILRYLSLRSAPLATGDPDGWATEAETTNCRRELLAALGDAHDDVDAALQTSETASAKRQRAGLAANRVLAIATVTQSEGGSQVSLDDDLLGTLTPHRTEGLKALMSDVLEELLGGDDANDQAGLSALLLNALGVVELLWNGDTSSFAALCESIARLRLPTDMRVSAIASCLRSATTDEVRSELLLQLLAIVEGEPPERQRQLRASAGESVFAVLARIAHAMPAEASALAGRFAGFGSDRARWSGQHRHLWLIPGRPAVAIIDHGTGAETFALDGLEHDTIAELTELHAEEHIDDHDPGAIRRRLSTQLKPLALRLADLDEPLSFYAFGHLKHIPLPALTGRSQRLAARPGLYRLAHRQVGIDSEPLTNTQEGRTFVVDGDVPAFRHVRTGSAQVHRFDSTDRTLDGIPVAFEQLTAGWDEVIFFGHGYVDQYDSRHVGLVTRFTDAGPGFVPAAVFAGFDLRSTRLAVIVSCGSGQGNVFLEPHATVADGFCLGGARAVIAPIWPVRSDHAASFLHGLLARLDRGESALDAWAALVEQDPNRYCSICLFTD